MSSGHHDRRSAGVSTAAVRKATGKSWEEWFEILDAAGASNMDHKEIVAILKDEHNVSPWWQQMVTVAYEQDRGLRAKHETPAGFQVSRSKTINISLSELYRAWVDEQLRDRWLANKNFTVRAATQNKSIRITWEDVSNVEALFTPKGEKKSQVTVQHGKLADGAEAEKYKAYWGKALDKLKDLLEG